MNKKILIKKEEFEGILLKKIEGIERVDVTEDGVEIIFTIKE